MTLPLLALVYEQNPLLTCPCVRRVANEVAPDGSFNAPHTPKYDFNDDIIPDGIAYCVNIVRHQFGDIPGLIVTHLPRF